MILYRAMSSVELVQRMRGNYNPTKKTGSNTFKYELGQEYMHFFKYAEHAKYYSKYFGIIVARCDIPDEYIEQFGFGFYDKLEHGNMKELKDTAVPIPEYIIKKDNFNSKYLKGFANELPITWTNPVEHGKNILLPYTIGYLYYNFIYELKKMNYKNLEIVNMLKDKDLDMLLLDLVNDEQKINSLTK